MTEWLNWTKLMSMKNKLVPQVHEMKYQIVLISQLVDKSKFLIMKKLSNHILHIIADFQTTCSNAKFHAFLHYIIPVYMWYNVLSVTNNRWIFSLSVREELGGNKDPSDFLTSLPISITLTSKCAYGWFLLRLWKPDLTLLGLVQGEDSWESPGQQGDQTSQS